MLGIVLNAFVLYILVFAYFRGATVFHRYKIFVLAIAVPLVELGLYQAISGMAGAMAAMVVGFGLLIAGLVYWCHIETRPAFKIAGIYLAYRVLLFAAASFVFREAAPAIREHFQLG